MSSVACPQKPVRPALWDGWSHSGLLLIVNLDAQAAALLLPGHADAVLSASDAQGLRRLQSSCRAVVMALYGCNFMTWQTFSWKVSH